MPKRSSPSLASTQAPVDWSWLRSFVAVMDGGTLTAAARTLGMTQPTVGRHIRALELRLGETLFDRQPRGLLPTARALELYDRSAAVEQAVAALSASIDGVSPEPSGLVRITASVVLAVELLPRLVAPLLRQHAQMQVQLIPEDEVLNLVRREADVAIRFVRPTQPEVVAVKVGDLDIGLYASAAYLERAGTPIRLTDLAKHTWVAVDDPVLLVEELGARGVSLDPQKIQLQSANYLTQLAAIRAGVGIGVAQTWLAARCPELIRVLPMTDVSRLPVWLATHDDFHRSTRIRIVFDHLVIELKQLFEQACPEKQKSHRPQ